MNFTSGKPNSMDVFEAVSSRIACRGFIAKPVDPKIVKDILTRAARAASGGNLQPWNVYALTGKPLAEFKAIVQKRLEQESPLHAKTEYQVYPEPMFGAYKDRREDHGVQLYGSLGIDRKNPAARLAQFNKNFEFFGAPVALFITIDRRLGPGQWSDLGGYIHALAFLARGYGLDTCPQEAWARLYDTVGDFLKLPDNEMLFCGMAIGYGDGKHKANDFRSPRADLS